jgi:hypothetical protein
MHYEKSADTPAATAARTECRSYTFIVFYLHTALIIDSAKSHTAERTKHKRAVTAAAGYAVCIAGV